MTDSFKKAFVPPDLPMSRVLQNMNQSGLKTVLVVDPDETLLGIITDWDIRTAILNGLTLETPIVQFMNTQPAVALEGLSHAELREILIKNGNDCLPVVNAENRVVDFIQLRDFVEEDPLLNPVVIMAGGAGKRLLPLTEDVPKPLLPVADKPVLEHILNRIKTQGFEQVWVTTHYQSEKIEAFLDTHAPDGIEVNMIREELPQGTAGALKTLDLEKNGKPIFIINGDILTTLDLQDILNWHITHGNLLTVASRQFETKLPYGVLNTDGQSVTQLEEKPVKCYNINAGIYLLEREALAYIPDNVHFDMTDLIDTLLAAGLPVGAFPIAEPWIDIGRHEDYTFANLHSHQYLPAGVPTV